MSYTIILYYIIYYIMSNNIFILMIQIEELSR